MGNRLQILISAVNKDPEALIRSNGIECDAIVVNQVIDGSEAAEGAVDLVEDKNIDGKAVRIVTMHRKGVGLSRNTALDNADHEIIQFGDDDIVYNSGCSALILEEFDKHKEADVILFNVLAQPGRETYWNQDYKRVSWFNYGRYPAYAICARLSKLKEAGVKYSLLFGGGAPYMNGEDSLFLHDCLKAGLKVYRTTVELGHEMSTGTSTWFKGYTEKFFFDRGVLYHFLYGKAAFVWGLRYLLKNNDNMCDEMGFFKCFGTLLKGVKHGKGLKKV